MEGDYVSLVPLNIATDYPINWEFKRILRDLIQNFYDAIGYEKFDEEFLYNWKGNQSGGIDIEMKTYGHPFNYEWLAYVGGSTKTDSPGDYIGMYGEGFKMCMLCLERLGWGRVTMESQTWKIEPCRYAEEIEDKKICMLGYELSEREDDGWTKLTLCNVPRYYHGLLSEALLDFFYPQNLLFGEKLYETDEYAIYNRSDVKVPCKNYTTINGILYCNFLARGRLPFGVILLERKDMRKKDSRKREVLEDYEVKESIYHLFERMNAQASFIMLEKMEEYWVDMPKKMVDVDTWYYAICQLVRNVSKDGKWVEIFKEKYNDLVYIERKSTDGTRNQLIEQTNKWYLKNKHGRMVNPIFRLLGASSLVKEYQSIRVVLFEVPSETEMNYIRILFLLVETIFPYKLYDEKPIVVIQKDAKVKCSPLLFARKIYGGQRNDSRVYQLDKLVMSHEDFERGKFVGTLLKFADILIHAYGTTRNAKVNVLLTHFGAACVKHRKILSEYAEVWDAGKIIQLG